MYIKLSFHEQIVIVPGSWGGVVICLSANPEIIDKLPKDIKADQRVNEKTNGIPNKKSYVPSNYDYYLDCGNTNLETIQKALISFNDRFKNKSPGTIIDESNPTNNPIIFKLKADLFRAENPSSISSLFSKSISKEKDRAQEVQSLIERLIQ